MKKIQSYSREAASPKIFRAMFGILGILFVILIANGVGAHDLFTSISTGAVALATSPLIGMDREVMLNEAKRLERRASENLSNYDGYGSDPEFSYYDGNENYEGMDNFAGINRLFSGAIDKRTFFIFTVANVNAATRTMIISPGLRDGLLNANPAGTVATGAFNDTAGGAGLSGTGSPRNIEMFLDFIRFSPMTALGVKISSDVQSQLSQTWQIDTLSPFKPNPIDSDLILPDVWVDENTFQTKVATLPRPIDFNQQVRITIPVVGTSTITITLFAGPILNLIKTQKAAINKVARRSLGLKSGS